MRHLTIALLLVCGCTPSITKALTEARSKLDRAEAAYLAAANEYCDLVDMPDECSIMQDEAAALAERVNAAKAILAEQIDRAADMDRALRSRR